MYIYIYLYVYLYADKKPAPKMNALLGLPKSSCACRDKAKIYRHGRLGGDPRTSISGIQHARVLFFTIQLQVYISTMPLRPSSRRKQ